MNEDAMHPMPPVRPDTAGSDPTGPTPQDPAPRACVGNTLRGGVRGGNPANGARCLARTRAGSACQGPAMRNKHGTKTRCRLHGGLSTGARTPAGRARAAAANRRHGAFGAEMQAALKQMRALRAEAARLVAEHIGRQRHKRRAATTASPNDGKPT